MEDLSDDELYCVVTAIMSVIIEHDDPVVQHDSALTGRAYYDELLANPSWARFHDVARMDKDVFLQLLHILTTEGGLEDSEEVCAGEKVLYLINALCGWTNRMLHERWQHSGSTLSIQAVIRCKRIFFTRPEDLSQNDPKFYPYFKDCIGALDGTHIPAVIPTDDAAPFRNHKGDLSQNVLGVVNFDITFTYALVGWEGSGHDGSTGSHDRILPLDQLLQQFNGSLIGRWLAWRSLRRERWSSFLCGTWRFIAIVTHVDTHRRGSLFAGHCTTFV
jgi:hypothetical protein